ARRGGFAAELVRVETVMGGGETVAEALRSLCTRLAHLVDHARDPLAPIGIHRQAALLRAWLEESGGDTRVAEAWGQPTGRASAGAGRRGVAHGARGRTASPGPHPITSRRSDGRPAIVATAPTGRSAALRRPRDHSSCRPPSRRFRRTPAAPVHQTSSQSD